MTPRCPESDIDTLVAWVDAGAPLGDPKDMPAPKQFVEGWTIPKPDIVFQLPKPFPVPATGVLEYQYVIIPTGFTKDTWVEQVQAAPTNYSVVHHIVAYVRAPGSNYFKDMPKNEFFEAPPSKKDGDESAEGRRAERLAHRLRARPAARHVQARPGEADSRRFGHRAGGPLHAGGQGRRPTSRGWAWCSPRSRPPSAP